MTNFDEIINKTFDRFKKITPALIAVAITTGLILFLPEPNLKKIGVNDLTPKLRTIIGMVFILSSALICTIIFNELFKQMKEYLRTKKLNSSVSKLSNEQKEILKKLFSSSEKNIELSCISGDTVYLEDNNFIFQPAQKVDLWDIDNNKRIYVPHPWLMRFYEKNPLCLDIKTEVTNYDKF